MEELQTLIQAVACLPTYVVWVLCGHLADAAIQILKAAK